MARQNHYVASDYAGLHSKNVSFYFGYEATLNDEWCFSAKVKGRDEELIPQSKLGVSRGSDMSEFLLAGIALWLNDNFPFSQK